MYVNSAICLPFELHLTCNACSSVRTALFELRCTISNLLPCPIELLVEQYSSQVQLERWLFITNVFF